MSLSLFPQNSGCPSTSLEVCTLLSVLLVMTPQSLTFTCIKYVKLQLLEMTGSVRIPIL